MGAIIKAIETRYKGCRFRSRLEARWAVFFDALGMKWEYEPEGFETSLGKYLPDFYLPQLDYWIEIKPNGDNCKYETEALQEICEYKGGLGFVFIKSIFIPEIGNGVNAEMVYPGWDHPYSWAECSQCGRIEMTFDSRGERLSCRSKTCKDVGKDYNPAGVKLLRAYTAALSARFEHGECS